MRQVVITSAVRLPVGRFLGSLTEVHTGEMAATVARAALDRSGIEGSAVDEVVTSETYRGDLPGCSARPIALKAGVPLEVPGFNLNMHCGTGLKALVLASQMIRSDDAEKRLAMNETGGPGSRGAGAWSVWDRRSLRARRGEERHW